MLSYFLYMKRTIVFFLSLFFLSGCATYKFKHGTPPYDKGFVASRDGYTIVEYTVGKDNSVPEDLKTAKERLHKRRRVVEDYYKKMGYIENRFKRAIADPAVMCVKLIAGIFRLPFIAVSDYRYDHNPAYRERVKKIEEEKDLREETRIASLKQKLSLYIQGSLAREKPVVVKAVPEVKVEQVSKAESVEQELAHLETMNQQASAAETALEPAAAQKEQRPAVKAPKPKAVKPKPEKKKPVNKGEPRAVIHASPKKGYSPLTVHFSGAGSRSPSGRIVSYYWDFGDGDTSTLHRPRNTYYSGLSEPQSFTVTLTVKDSLGNTATSSAEIDVLNK